MRSICVCLLLLALVVTCVPACAGLPSMCRFYLISQYDWSGNKGFYLDMESSTLADMPLILGVSDGASWRFPMQVPGFVTGRDYQVHAVIAPDRTQLLLDGTLIADSPGGFMPSPSTVEVNHRPGWANEPGDWLCIVSAVSLTVLRGGVQVDRRDFDFSASAARPVPLQLFEPGSYTQAQVTVLPGDTVVLDVTMRFGDAVLSHWAPFLDAYGQCVYADLPNRVQSDADLVNDIATEDAVLETIPPSEDFDQYGGYRKAGWSGTPTGFFGVVLRDGYWWLITPEGNPCFYTALSVAPANTWPMTPVTGRESLFAWLPPHTGPWSATWGHDVWGAGDGADYVALRGTNLIRKYQAAPDWSVQADQRAIRRMRSLQFGGSKWGGPAGMPVTPVLGRGHTPNLVSHPDVWDPAVRAALRADLAAQVTPSLSDSYVIGWSVGSEKAEIVFGEEIAAILQMAATVPAKRALCDYGVDSIYAGSLSALNASWGTSATTREELYASSPTPPAADVETLRRHYADQYYALCYDTLKSIDPNHLVFAPYLCPFCAAYRVDWEIAGAHCDVLAYDHYAFGYSNDGMAELEQRVGKPAFCGEFSFPSWYGGLRGFGRYGVFSADEADAAAKYTQWLAAAATDPYCVGVSYFEYKDQPLTGRGAGSGDQLVYGEHYAFGLVTETDRMKWDLALPMREANLSAPAQRLEAAVPLAAGFTASPTSGDVPLAVSFADTSAGYPITWAWDFGDGGTAAEQNPMHPYLWPGYYTVTLTATSAGASDTATQEALIAASPWVEDDSAALSYAGTWTTYTAAAYSAGHLRASVQPGANAGLTFFGTGLRWRVAQGPRMGKARVSVDGTVVGVVDLYASRNRLVTLSRTGLTPGRHDIKVEVTGQRNRLSRGTMVTVDAFEVLP